MKISVALIALLAVGANAHMKLVFPPARGSPDNPNAGKQDFDNILAPLGANKPFPCGGYPPDKQTVTTFKAGDIVNVKFGGSARHGGGLCEFSLSYDNGKTFNLIGRYTKSCPDSNFDWPVQIPANAPSCTQDHTCLFAWTWVNAIGNREFYMGCSEVKIQGSSGGKLNGGPITRANLPGEQTLQPPGDGSGNDKGPGPSPDEVAKNKSGGFSGGGGKTNPNPEPAPSSTATSKPTVTKGKPTRTTTVSRPPKTKSAGAPATSSTQAPAGPVDCGKWKTTCQSTCLQQQLFNIQFNQCFGDTHNCKCNDQDLTAKIEQLLGA